MPAPSIARESVWFVAVDLIGDLLYWPVWWYTKGAHDVLLFFAHRLRSESRRLNLGVWVANLFVPMYGQYDLEGRIISFGMRLVVLTWRLLLIGVWLAGLGILWLGWLLLPVLVIYRIGDHLLRFNELWAWNLR